MEKAQAGTVHKSESSSPVTCASKTDTNELSKEKEEELLYGAEEGDDEDALSDDSLRLRLSDDEDAEQENATTNDTNIAKLKSQSETTERPMLDPIAGKTLCSDLQKTVEDNPKSDSEESAQKEHDTVKALENSTLSLNEYTSESERIQDNTCNSENTNVTLDESNKDCAFNSSKDLKMTGVSNACSSGVLKEHAKLKSDDSCTQNCTHTSNVEPTVHSEENLKEAASDSEKITLADTRELNKLDNVNSNVSSTDSTNAKICKVEKLFTTVIVSNSDDDKLGDKHVKNNNHSLKRSQVDFNNPADYVNLVKSDISKDLFKDTVTCKSNNKTLELVDITEDKVESNISKFVENVTNTSSIQNQSDSSSVKDNAEVTSEDRVANQSVTQTVDNNLRLQNISLVSNDTDHSNNEKETSDVGAAVLRKRIKRTTVTKQSGTEEDKQEEKEPGRQKRKTARNAEEIIRKKYLVSDSDSSDSSEQFVTLNKVSQNIHPVSPSPLKRYCSENEVFNGNTKKAKMTTEEKKDVAQLSFIEKFFRRDFKERLPRLTQEELEELLIQKIVETIAMRSEIGQLREQARISERYQETTRVKMQQLIKQVKDFEMVLNRNAIDRRANPDKTVAPIKINRSVGLQVSFITEHGMQNLRQTANVKPTANTANSTDTSTTETINNATSPRRVGIKVRSPRPVVTVSAPVITQTHPVQTAPVLSTVTPAALVVAKPVESSHPLTLPNQSTNIQPILPAPQQQIQSQSHQTIVLNGKIQNQVNRPPLIAPKPRNNDLIDLTDEEEKNKSKITTATAASIIEQQLNVTSKPAQSFPRVLQAIPANVAIAAQPTSIKVITTNQQPTSTALVNNVNPPRLAYVMQSGTGSPRQVLIANSNQQVQIRPVNAPRSSFSTVTYKTGVPTLTNGAVRVLTTPVLPKIQISKHPAPLPDIPNYAATPGWKFPPPAPSLKISKVSNGIVLSWNMNLTDKFADIASYQLYAYQEVAGVSPSTSLWKKVGDVRALPLPMACTLTQFSEGNNYYFAVRAVDTHSRKGQYSIPGNISL
ncbi:PREDICTED: activating transcription factor 7-interacting protein 1 isoform X2 [Vollenhovia emeryi]|uniref:activating transcription factor 7-interacting protein 1 isoform X2 n=1 Tax=Vollenhovia emeryi TaxID=411798 RepID=UPI0005F464AB|nr:PREDICTED: activating transcription factor 7-interacting protein 1 isoform X2 [Vollenhovia emeryi]